jgi:catechol 2,3-dioxygenase
MTISDQHATAGTTDRDVRYAQFHHVNFITTRKDAMRDWYVEVFDMDISLDVPFGCWMTNDRANHRVALTALPGVSPDPDRRYHARMHHVAFEYQSFDDLNATYLRLREKGIVPKACLDHGMTTSYYYEDPDGNYVELQCDNFGDWDKSRAYMKESLPFSENPIGAFIDPAKVADAYAAGESHADILKRAWDTTELRPDEFPDMGGPEPRPGDPPLPAKY